MRIIEILEILQKYNIDESYPLWAEHDIIGFNIDWEKISKEDLESLTELNVHYDSEYDGLVIYV